VRMARSRLRLAHPARDGAEIRALGRALRLANPLQMLVFMRTRSFFFLAFLGVTALAAGCDGDPNPEPEETGTIPEQLEAFQVTVENDSGSPVSSSGTLAITGSEREFQIVLDDPAVGMALEIHTPGATPLTQLDGIDATVELSEMGMGGRSIVISDDDGPLYVGALGDSPGLNRVRELFGEGFVKWGAEVGTQTDGTFVWTYKPAVFATDDGDVELQPGEVDSIVVAGVEWRVVVSASYEVGTNPDADALPACSPESMLGFELLRVPEPAEITTIARLAEAPVAYVGCTAPGGEE
jgi:hypothetical protein